MTFDLRALAIWILSRRTWNAFPAFGLPTRRPRRAALTRIALNAADEVAVAAFLEGRISFMDIPRTIEEVLAATPASHPATIAEVLEVDAQSRERARARIAARAIGARKETPVRA